MKNFLDILLLFILAILLVGIMGTGYIYYRAQDLVIENGITNLENLIAEKTTKLDGLIIQQTQALNLVYILIRDLMRQYPNVDLELLFLEAYSTVKESLPPHMEIDYCKSEIGDCSTDYDQNYLIKHKVIYNHEGTIQGELIAKIPHTFVIQQMTMDNDIDEFKLMLFDNKLVVIFHPKYETGTDITKVEAFLIHLLKTQPDFFEQNSKTLLTIDRIFSYKKLQNDYVFCVCSDKNTLLSSVEDIRIYGVLFMTLGIFGLIAIFLFFCTDKSHLFSFSFIKVRQKNIVKIELPKESRAKIFSDSLTRLINITDKIAASELDQTNHIQISSKMLDYTRESVDALTSFVSDLVKNTSTILDITNLTEYANNEFIKPEYDFERKLKEVAIKVKRIKRQILPGEIKETFFLIEKAIHEILLSLKRLKDISGSQLEAVQKLHNASVRLTAMCEEIHQKTKL